MLFVLIPLVWLAVAAFFVILCRMAARGDASAAVPAHAEAFRQRTVPRTRARWEDAPFLAASRRTSVSTVRRGVSRSRGARCVTGS